MTQIQQKSLISIIAVLLIAGLIVSLNVDDEGVQSSVSVMTPSNANTSVDNRVQVTPSNTNQTKNPFDSSNNSNRASSEVVNNDPRLPPGFPEPLPPLDKTELKQTDALISEADAIVAKMDALIAELDLPEPQLSEAQQIELQQQQVVQQQRIDQIKQQLETIKQDL